MGMMLRYSAGVGVTPAEPPSNPWRDPDAPDVMYPVKPGDDNEELRYSLRSLVNVPHRDVVIVGHKPPWVTGVRFIPTDQTGYRRDNAYGNLAAACLDDGMTETFTFMNDDFFVMQPVESVGVAHRGPLDRVIVELAAQNDGRYVDEMRATAARLAELGVKNPKCYELHTPMVMTKSGVLTALDGVKRLGSVQARTLYGNVSKVGGRKIADVKVNDKKSPGPDGPFLSTAPGKFATSRVGLRIREQFPDPSPYEI